jgi:hypothetical protein
MAAMTRFRKTGFAVTLASAWILLVASAEASDPRRTEFGDLIVLDVYGSYQEMGRQTGELLGEEGRRVYELNMKLYRSTLGGGLGSWIYDRIVLPLSVRFLSDDTGLFEEAAGYASALGVSRTDMLRSQIGAGAAAGSTVFAASRSATADGNALIGRNVDWVDFGGRLRPTVIRHHPENGDLRYISVAWPLLQLPTVGLNEAGLAFSLNYFATDPQMEPTSTSYPYRRILQKARTVEEAIELFQTDFPIVISTFGALADAAGEIALLECTTARCEVFRPEGDWFAHSNHARTEAMKPEDLFRGPDSLDRRRLMERAVESRLGRLDALQAAEILRDRSGHPFANASVVGNLFVLNAAVVEPARGILWHSDAMQPYAPFGQYVPITIGDASEHPAPIPASPYLETEKYRREAAAVARVRAALAAHLMDDDAETANELWELIFTDPPGDLDLSRISLGWAYSLVAAGRFAEAASVLDTHVDKASSREARIRAAMLKGACADGRGRREEAAAYYGVAAALMGEVPDLTVYVAPRSLAERGMRRALAPGDQKMDGWVTHVPQ